MFLDFMINSFNRKRFFKKESCNGGQIVLCVEMENLESWVDFVGSIQWLVWYFMLFMKYPWLFWSFIFFKLSSLLNQTPKSFLILISYFCWLYTFFLSSTSSIVLTLTPLFVIYICPSVEYTALTRNLSDYFFLLKKLLFVSHFPITKKRYLLQTIVINDLFISSNLVWF